MEADESQEQFTINIPEIHKKYKLEIENISHKDLCELLGTAISTNINRQQTKTKSNRHHIRNHRSPLTHHRNERSQIAVSITYALH